MTKPVLSLLLGLLLVFGGLSFGKTAKKRSSRRASTAAKSQSVKSASSKKSRSRAMSSTRTASSKKKTSRTRAVRNPRSKKTIARRSTQQNPTPARYTEIQQALADKGYYNGPVDGTWSADSIEALKRFQKDQHLTESGKLNSVSIIALGLGPKRNLSARSTTESRPTDDNRRPEGSERP